MITAYWYYFHLSPSLSFSPSPLPSIFFPRAHSLSRTALPSGALSFSYLSSLYLLPLPLLPLSSLVVSSLFVVDKSTIPVVSANKRLTQLAIEAPATPREKQSAKAVASGSKPIRSTTPLAVKDDAVREKRSKQSKSGHGDDAVSAVPSSAAGATSGSSKSTLPAGRKLTQDALAKAKAKASAKSTTGGLPTSAAKPGVRPGHFDRTSKTGKAAVTGKPDYSKQGVKRTGTTERGIAE